MFFSFSVLILFCWFDVLFLSCGGTPLESPAEAVHCLVEVAAAVHLAAADEVLVAADGGYARAAELEAALHAGLHHLDHGRSILPFAVLCHVVLMFLNCCCLLYENSFRHPCLSRNADIL